MRVIVNVLMAAAGSLCGDHAAGVSDWQPRLIYFPQVDRETDDRIRAPPRPSTTKTSPCHTADGMKLHAWWVPARDPAPAAVLMMHGNAGQHLAPASAT